MPEISVVNYGVGNLRSVKKGLEKSGARATITQNPRNLSNADAIVFPGVGAFAAAVKNLAPIASIVTQLVENGKPLFGICLGLQLLFTRSSEGGRTYGLNFISGDVVKIPETVKIPQMGWNTLDIVKSHPLLEGIQNYSYAYFVHTYVPKPSKNEVIVANTEYGIRFHSVIAKQNVLATQFHPEKSGKTGLTILKNFIKIVKR